MLAALPFELQVLATHNKLETDVLKLSKCLNTVRTKRLHLLSYVRWMDCGRTEEAGIQQTGKGNKVTRTPQKVPKGCAKEDWKIFKFVQ